MTSDLAGKGKGRPMPDFPSANNSLNSPKRSETKLLIFNGASWDQITGESNRRRRNLKSEEPTHEHKEQEKTGNISKQTSKDQRH